jgi:hypothetical protein
LWQQLFRNKYVKDKTLSQLTKSARDSHFWMSFMRVKGQFLKLGVFRLGEGTQIRFLEDTWLGRVPLKLQYPTLYNIVWHKQATIASILSTTLLNVSFRRALVGNKLLEWQHLVARIANIQLQVRRDILFYSLKIMVPSQ